MTDPNTSRRRSMAIDPSNAEVMAKVGDLAERIAGLSATVIGQGSTIAGISTDAREARDTAQRLAARIEGQEIPAQLERLHGEIAAVGSGLRADMTNTYTRLKADMLEADSKLAGRLESLEKWKLKLEGSASVFGWLSKNAPWLLTLLAWAALVVVGMKVKP